MSQNAHTLTLFFEPPLLHRQFQLLLQYLQRDDAGNTARWAQELGGVDAAQLWGAPARFNHWFAGHRTHLVYGFETGTSAPVPWALLEHLGRHGLRAAVMEVFYDQVCERERYHIDAGQWIGHREWLARHPQHRALIDPEGGIYPPEGATPGPAPNPAPDCTLNDPARPTPVAQVAAQQATQAREARETVQALAGLAAELRGKGVSPVEAVVGFAVLGAGLKGLWHAVLFTVVTALLFKGLWLWLGLGLLLAVAWPLFYMHRARQRWEGDGDDDDESAIDRDGGTAPKP